MDQQEYFTVQHSLSANIEPLDSDFVLPEQEAFVEEIPTPFLVATEFSALDSLTDKAINELRNSDLSNVVQLLESQNSKLNLLLTFMLSQQDDARLSHKTESFGASQFTYLTSQPPEQDQLARVKLFIERPASAVYCYGKVTAVEQGDDTSRVTIVFVRMRDEDQDLLIKAALFQQQKLLRKRSLERDEKN